jgi:crossover junction endodeoxyribonuclease RuvC
MRILGVDPGIGTTGFAVLEEISGALVWVASGEIRVADKMRKGECEGGRRLKYIFMKIGEIITFHKPEVVALEDIFFAKNVKSALTLGQAKGVAMLAAEMNNLPVFEYSPRAVKMAVVGVGAATKDQVKIMVSRILNLSMQIFSEHTADAAAIAICHAHSARWQEKLAVQAR